MDFARPNAQIDPVKDFPVAGSDMQVSDFQHGWPSPSLGWQFSLRTGNEIQGLASLDSSSSVG
jgi:hypothetical protein